MKEDKSPLGMVMAMCKMEQRKQDPHPNLGAIKKMKSESNYSLYNLCPPSMHFMLW